MSPKALLTLLRLPYIRIVDVQLTDETSIPLRSRRTSPVTTLRFAPVHMTAELLSRILKIRLNESRMRTSCFRGADSLPPYPLWRNFAATSRNTAASTAGTSQ